MAVGLLLLGQDPSKKHGAIACILFGLAVVAQLSGVTPAMLAGR